MVPPFQATLGCPGDHVTMTCTCKMSYAIFASIYLGNDIRCVYLLYTVEKDTPFQLLEIPGLSDAQLRSLGYGREIQIPVSGK